MCFSKSDISCETFYINKYIKIKKRRTERNSFEMYRIVTRVMLSCLTPTHPLNMRLNTHSSVPSSSGPCSRSSPRCSVSRRRPRMPPSSSPFAPTRREFADRGWYGWGTGIPPGAGSYLRGDDKEKWWIWYGDNCNQIVKSRHATPFCDRNGSILNSFRRYVKLIKVCS